MAKESVKCDLLIIGAGAIGFSIGIAYLDANPEKKVLIADKENQIGKHASGRNSGVLHAGFYYSPDSLKAKFCREGNTELRKIAKKYNLIFIEDSCDTLGGKFKGNPTGKYEIKYQRIRTQPVNHTCEK